MTTPTERAAWMMSVFLDAARAGRTDLDALPYLPEVEEVIEALKLPFAAPEGRRLVPVEPTENMAKADMNPSMTSWKQRYSAMLAAAATLPAAQEREAK